MKSIFQKALIAGLLSFSTTVAVAEVITLTDGSTINGEVLSMNGGSYQIKTTSLGVISLNKSQVSSISAGISAPREAPQASSNQSVAVKSIQSAMTSDRGIMDSIRSLQNDPDMQAVLQDPEVMQAVQSFDLQSLANHPKIKRLMQNAEVKRIQGKFN
jgi:hypothetical protein